MAKEKGPVRTHTHKRKPIHTFKPMSKRSYSTYNKNRHDFCKKQKENNYKVITFIKDFLVGGIESIVSIYTFFFISVTSFILIILISIIVYVFINHNILLIPWLECIVLSVFSFLFTISLLLYYLDDFKLSRTNRIWYIQVFVFLCIPIIIVYIIFNHISIDIIDKVKDNDINLHGHISLNKEATKELSKGIVTAGSMLGSSAAIAGVASAVSKTIVKSSIPPVQKLAIVGAGGLIGGLLHYGVSQANRASALDDMVKSSIINKSGNNISKFMDNSVSDPLEGLLFTIQGLNSVCLTLIFILIIQLFIRLHIKNDIKSIFGIKFDIYLNKLVSMNKKVSVLFLWLAILLLLIGILGSLYFSNELYNNIDKYIDIHNFVKNK
jgi:hypothetical protein